MKSLRKFWAEFRSELSTAEGILLFLDFDGTLAPIARDPESVRLDFETKKILSKLSASDRIRLCVISGRRIRALRSILGLKNVCYVGNHGFEIQASGVAPPTAAIAPGKIRKILRPVAQRLKAAFKSFSGVLFEDKRHTLSLHFRNVAEKDLKNFRKRFEDIKSGFLGLSLIWREGKRVFEVLPNIHWNKGSAALVICDRFPDRLPVILGDDRTDEDMFRALKKRGITVRVGRSQHSEAEYYLTSQRQVAAFLKKMLFLTQ